MLRHKVISPRKVHFESPDRDSECGYRYTSAHVPPGVPPRFLKAIIRAVERVGARLSSETIPKIAASMSDILNFHTYEGMFSYRGYGWDDALYLHLIATLRNEKVQQRSRIMRWQNIEKVYKELVRLGAIPSGVHIPSGTVRNGCTEDALPPIGHERKEVNIPLTMADLLPKSELIAEGLELDDDEFIDKLKKRLQNQVDTYMTHLTDYWNKMRDCWDIGQHIISKVPATLFEERLGRGEFVVNGLHIAHPASLDGIAWFLRGVQHYTFSTYELSMINFNQMIKLPFFKELLEVDEIESLIVKKLLEVCGDSAPPVVAGNRQPTEIASRLLGLLSKRDCATACCILITENPSFTPDAIENADLYTQNGKLYLRAQTLHQRLIFSVSKPRAVKRKVSVLSPLSAGVVNDVVHATSQMRLRQKFFQQRNWRKLFLMSSRKKMSSIARPSSIISTGSGITLYSLFQREFESAGIDKLSFNLSTMRSTQAIVCFLSHGSIKMVSNLLNNSIQVVKKSYIPLWMMIYWGNRILRSIQQKLIIVATEGSPWQTEASDFVSAEALRKFITKILRKLKRGDAFSEMIRERLGKYATEPLQQPYTETDLLIPLGIKELAFLYAYADIVEPRNTVSSAANDYAMTDEQIRSLVDLMRQCDRIQDDKLSDADYAVLANIAGDSRMQFQRTHIEATRRAEALKPLFRNKLPIIEQRGDI